MKQTLIWTFLAVLVAGTAQATDQMRMAVTTSFHNSGLADVLLPEIKRDLDLEVQLLVVGTGQALKLGQAGDVGAILGHSRAGGEGFLADGFRTPRRAILYQDFVFVGPSDDPSRVAGAE
ncbi:MAG: substrate-binding domain-containing protein, partial [Tateyamaria sp.]